MDFQSIPLTTRTRRQWGLFTPDSDPSVAFVQTRVATASVSDEFIRAANTLVHALRHFHTNAGRGSVWNPAEYHPDGAAHPNSRPTTGTPTAATPPHPTVATLTLATVPPSPPHQDNDGHDGHDETYDEGGTSLRFGPLQRGRHAQIYARTAPVPGEHRRRRMSVHVPRQRKTGDKGNPRHLRRLGETIARYTSVGKRWEITLHKCFRKALGSPQIMASPPACLIDDFFVQVRQELGIDETGSSAS